jgi:hypothetical protein
LSVDPGCAPGGQEAGECRHGDHDGSATTIVMTSIESQPEEQGRSRIQPFSIRTNYRSAASSKGMANPVLIYQNGGTAFIRRAAMPRNG